MVKDNLNGTSSLTEPKVEAENIVDVGALVLIDDEVLKHGVLFTHPALPPFKLIFTIIDGELKHRFEILQTKKPKSGIIKPKGKIVMPGGNA